MADLVPQTVLIPNDHCYSHDYTDKGNMRCIIWLTLILIKLIDWNIC